MFLEILIILFSWNVQILERAGSCRDVIDGHESDLSGSSGKIDSRICCRKRCFPLGDVFCLADQFKSVARSLEVHVLPVLIRETTVPEI